MNKELLKQALKEMFATGELYVDIWLHERTSGSFIEVTIKIDNIIVATFCS